MRAIVAGLCFIAPNALFGQTTAAPPVFEVASVKPNLMSKAGGEGSRRERVNTSPGSLNMRNTSLSSCIKWAYDIGEFQIAGPNWLGGERFDVVAKAAGPANDEELKVMLQALLADRFKLAVHRETKVMPVYVLGLAKNGSKMHASEGDGEPGINPIRGREVIGIQRTSMALAGQGCCRVSSICPCWTRQASRESLTLRWISLDSLPKTCSRKMRCRPSLPSSRSNWG